MTTTTTKTPFKIMQELYNNQDSLPKTLKLLKPLLSLHFTKGDMLKEIERIEGKELTIDFAIPWQFQKSLIDLGVDTTFFVWSYEKSLMGKPLHLIERYFQAFNKALEK